MGERTEQTNVIIVETGEELKDFTQYPDLDPLGTEV